MFASRCGKRRSNEDGVGNTLRLVRQILIQLMMMMMMMTMMVMNLGQLTECDKNPDSNNAKDGRFVPDSEQQ